MSDAALRVVPPGLAAAPAARVGASRPDDDPAKVRDAAQQFEALLITQILQAAGTAGEMFGTGSDSEGNAVSELAMQQFAMALSQQGGLGLAGLISQGIHPAGSDSSL